MVANPREAELGTSPSCSERAASVVPRYVSWGQKFGVAGVPELQRLMVLEHGNARLKRMYADQSIEMVAIKEV